MRTFLAIGFVCLCLTGFSQDAEEKTIAEKPKDRVTQAVEWLKDNTPDPEKFSVSRTRQGKYDQMPGGVWLTEATVEQRVEWTQSKPFVGMPFVWVKYREANILGATEVKDKTFVWVNGIMQPVLVPPQVIWRSEKVADIISPEESERLANASNRLMGDMFGILNKQVEENQAKNKRRK